MIFPTKADPLPLATLCLCDFATLPPATSSSCIYLHCALARKYPNARAQPRKASLITDYSVTVNAPPAPRPQTSGKYIS